MGATSVGSGTWGGRREAGAPARPEAGAGVGRERGCRLPAVLSPETNRVGPHCPFYVDPSMVIFQG